MTSPILRGQAVTSTVIAMENQLDGGTDDTTEQTPLMPKTPDQQRSPSTRPEPSIVSLATVNVHVPKVHSNHTIVNLLCAIIFVAASSDGFSQIPLTKLIENAFCRQYYNDWEHEEPIKEQLCKEGPIQSKVAFVFAVTGACDAIVGFLALLPWGIAADRIGRKPVLALALIGGALGSFWWIVVLWFQPVLPIWLGWLSSLTLLLGGGNAVLVAVILSIVADVATEDLRAIFFMRIHVASLLGNLVSPALSSAMMNVTGPLPVMWVGIACLLSAAIAFMFIPETLHHKHIDETSHPTGLKNHLSKAFGQLKESLSLLKLPLILLLTTSFLTAPIVPATIQLIIQFVSKRYRVKIKDVGYVQSVYGVAQVFQALVGLPVLSYLLTNATTWPFRMKSDEQRDLSLARWSFFILIPGLLILGAAPTLGAFVFGLVILAIGSGYSSLARALMSFYVDHEHHSRLFSLVSMVDVAGSVYSGPMLAGLFSLGMKLGGNWIGLPYFTLAMTTAIASFILLFVRLPRKDEGPPLAYSERMDEN